MALSDSQVVDRLKTRRDAVLEELAALTSTSAGGKPNSSLTGIDHAGYKRGLYEELQQINAQLAAYDGPWEITVEGVT